MKYILSILFLSISFFAFGQKAAHIRLVKADNLKPVEYKGVKVMRLNGNVQMKHKKTILYSDSAYLYEAENNMDAYGHIYINDNDSIHIYGDSLHFNGDSGIAELHGNVILKDRKMTLTTDHMIYNVKTKVANYYGGGKIINEDNVLVSVYGYYYSRPQNLFFQKEVVLTNPQYVMESDTLKYNVPTKISYFKGPTWIRSKENSIYCENGWYDTQNDVSQYDKNAVLYSGSQSLTGDSLYYDRVRGFGQGFHNVVMTDTVQNVIVKGNYAEYFERGGSSLITDSTLAIMISEEGDSLFMHCDTLVITFDSLQNAQEMLCYHHTKFYRDDLQGMCDSLVYLFEDSVIQMYFQPLLWANESQLSGKFIHLSMENGAIDRMYVDTNAFVLSHDTLDNFNQVSGRNMVIYFSDNSVHKVDVTGNAQTVYFVRNDDGELVGVNLSISSDLRVILGKKGIKDIIYLRHPDASLNPKEKLSRRALFLKGFHNYEYLRPQSKMDIFRWDG
jgi:lipopolysaccharide export system protein LptA